MEKRMLIGGILLACLLFATALFYRTNQDGFLHGTFGGVSLRIEVVQTDAARELGLGGRTTVAPDYGMLFVFANPDKYGFWMKDMTIPIDIFWLDSSGVVVSKQEDVSPESYPTVFYPEVPAQYVLETQAGFAEAHGIATGTPLQLQKFPTVLQ